MADSRVPSDAEALASLRAEAQQRGLATGGSMQQLRQRIDAQDHQGLLQPKSIPRGGQRCPRILFFVVAVPGLSWLINRILAYLLWVALEYEWLSTAVILGLDGYLLVVQCVIFVAVAVTAVGYLVQDSLRSLKSLIRRKRNKSSYSGNLVRAVSSPGESTLSAQPSACPEADLKQSTEPPRQAAEKADEPAACAYASNSPLAVSPSAADVERVKDDLEEIHSSIVQLCSAGLSLPDELDGQLRFYCSRVTELYPMPWSEPQGQSLHQVAEHMSVTKDLLCLCTTFRALYAQSFLEQDQRVAKLKECEESNGFLARQYALLQSEYREVISTTKSKSRAVKVMVQIRNRDREDRDPRLAGIVTLKDQPSTLSIVRQQGTDRSRTVPQSLSFSHVQSSSHPDTTTAEVLKHHAQAVLHGHHVCIVMDGHTGTGKTYSMFDGPDAVAKITINHLLVHLHSIRPQSLPLVCSILQVHQQEVDDLLQAPDAPGRPTIESLNKGFKAPGLQEREFPTLAVFQDVLAATLKRRSTRATCENSRSSRSHLVCVVHVPPPEPSRKSSCLVLIDLAGSERQGPTPKNQDSRILETERVFINSGRSHFKLAVRNFAIGLPPTVRGEKLTEVLSPCFGPASKLLWIARVSPLRADLPTTIPILNDARDVQR